MQRVTARRTTYQLVHTGGIITSANDAGPPRGLVHDGDCLTASVQPKMVATRLE
jgi:hypothetical protein